MEAKDRISELPTDICDHILGLLPINESARISVLSTFWRDAWLSLTHLKFDGDFFNYFKHHYMRESTMYVINKILMRHKGPVRRFVFHFSNFGKHSYSYGAMATSRRWADFDRLLLLITGNGVEEIDLFFQPNKYILRDCIFCCLTLKKLSLFGVFIEKINFPCIFPNVTSLCLGDVEFDSRNLLDYAAVIPTLESLTCRTSPALNISAPKLSSLKINPSAHGIHGTVVDSILPRNLDIRHVRSLHLGGPFLKTFVNDLDRMGLLQTALNVEHLELTVSFENDDISALALLLNMCPKLSKHLIHLKNLTVDRLWELPDDNVTLKCETLRELYIFCSFSGSALELLSFKWLLNCFPALEKLFINNSKCLHHNRDAKNKQKLLRYLRASTTAEIVYA
ncbi:unnamed protein product [Cuscuta epithymum]|uniref:F-box domain-containing protein n=1 Tax=Cuscuta epithymum TaxID=186058 RepID=A0AAV0DPW9_9ASTE|nr:unnamed protein product [Cuscuta epithymum]CAH9140746.1 unnamed protein product [Cuscuta epithymum]